MAHRSRPIPCPCRVSRPTRYARCGLREAWRGSARLAGGESPRLRSLCGRGAAQVPSGAGHCCCHLAPVGSKRIECPRSAVPRASRGGRTGILPDASGSPAGRGGCEQACRRSRPDGGGEHREALSRGRAGLLQRSGHELSLPAHQPGLARKRLHSPPRHKSHGEVRPQNGGGDLAGSRDG